MAQLTVKKRRKYSKKSKKNLRKYTDIRDVEEFLEEQRFQERTGGLVSEKKDEQLFFVQSEATSAEDRKKPSRAELRKRPLRSLSHLYGDPVINGTNEPTNPVGSVANVREAKARRLLLGGTASDSSEDEAEFDAGSRFSVRRQRETRELVRAVHRRLKKSALKPVMQDIWAVEGNSELYTLDNVFALDLDVATLSAALSAKDVPDEHFLRVTRKLPVKKPVSVGGRPSGLDSVPLPPPGSSYNPAFDDHQELLRSAVDVEEARLAADMKINKRLEAMEPMTATQREKVWQDEMIEGLIEEKEEEEEEERRQGT
ncbi:Ribosome biogenesis protein NOP53 [Geodia barretti]|uniref:Ribosome biogenesis protein NOP53 n=1 Tax=Geodia barretti TaxID=519541 RepID=A0AA35T562_GEOBA|nr:Ribosome biogenesis protein NOP53 [Geodia barretti]